MEWLHPGNHNLLRLTRIVRSLSLLGQPELARALYAGLRKECEGRVTAVTLEYWKEATSADAYPLRSALCVLFSLCVLVAI